MRCGCGRTLRIIKENLGWAFTYNLVAIPLAVAGVIVPRCGLRDGRFVRDRGGELVAAAGPIARRKVESQACLL